MKAVSKRRSAAIGETGGRPARSVRFPLVNDLDQTGRVGGETPPIRGRDCWGWLYLGPPCTMRWPTARGAFRPMFSSPANRSIHSPPPCGLARRSFRMSFVRQRPVVNFAPGKPTRSMRPSSLRRGGLPGSNSANRMLDDPPLMVRIIGVFVSLALAMNDAVRVGYCQSGVLRLALLPRQFHRSGFAAPGWKAR